MDKKASMDQLGVTGSISCKSINKHSADMETDDIRQLSSSPSVDNAGFALRPITPESNKEGSELKSCVTSPLTLVSSPPTEGFYTNESDDEIPSTPKAAVFDPFAPGPDRLMLAPCTMKCLQESRSYVERRLDFNSLTKNDREHVSESAVDNDDDDGMILEAVYDSLLECILSKQAEDFLGEISAVSSSPDAPVTPPFAPRLTGIAETCPGAPFKPLKKSRCIDLSLCRKLEFDFEV